jgi:excisionase family DNA binding protein
MGSHDELQSPWSATSLAEAADIDASYVARLCRQNKIKAIKFGRSWLISFEDGQRWLEERTTASDHNPVTLTED